MLSPALLAFLCFSTRCLCTKFDAPVAIDELMPTFRIRLTPRGVNYTNVVKNVLIDRTIAELYEAADFTYNDIYSFQSTNATVLHYTPATKTTFSLANNHYTRTAEGGQLTIEGAWSYTLNGQTKTGRYNTTFTNRLSRFSARLLATVDHALGIAMDNCQLDNWRLEYAFISPTDGTDLTTKVHIVEALKTGHKNHLQKAYCAMMETLLAKGSAAFLGHWPKTMDWPAVTDMEATFYLTNTTYIDNSLDLFAVTKVHYRGKTLEHKMPPVHLAKPLQSWNESMAIYQIGDNLINSYLMAAFHLGMMSKTLTRDSLGEKSSLLATTCKAICIGKFSGELAAKHPGKFIEIEIGASEAIRMRTTENGAVFNGTGLIRVGLENATNKDEKHLVTGTVVIGGSVTKMTVGKNSVKPKIKVNSFAVVNATSNLGDLQGARLLKLTKIIGVQGRGILQNFLKERFSGGVPLPVPKGVRLTGTPRIWYQKGALSIGSDFELAVKKF